VTGIEYVEAMKPLYKVSGKITYSSDDKYFPGAGASSVNLNIVVADGPFAGTLYYGVSLSEGVWGLSDIEGIPSGRYRVVVQAPSYMSATSVTVDPLETYIVVGNGPVSDINFVITRKYSN